MTRLGASVASGNTQQIRRSVDANAPIEHLSGELERDTPTPIVNGDHQLSGDVTRHNASHKIAGTQ